MALFCLQRKIKTGLILTLASGLKVLAFPSLPGQAKGPTGTNDSLVSALEISCFISVKFYKIYGPVYIVLVQLWPRSKSATDHAAPANP